MVLEVNGVAVNSPEQLIDECARAGEHITLKVGPNNHLSPPNNVIKNLKVLFFFIKMYTKHFN